MGIESIEDDGESLTVKGTKGFSANADLVLVAVGCRPSTTLAAEAGIQTGIKGAIKVNRRMQTNVSDIYRGWRLCGNMAQPSEQLHLSSAGNHCP